MSSKPSNDPCAAAGVILAGGLSTRMGRDKALLSIQQKTLLERASEALQSQVDDLVISRDPTLVPDAASAHLPPCIADTTPGNMGPLAGILSAMEHFDKTGNESPWLLSIAVDTPLVPGDLLTQLLDAAQKNPEAEIICPQYKQRMHPTCSLWKRSLKIPLKDYLEREAGRRVMTFISRRQLQTLDFDHYSDDPFFNINRPQDWVAIEAQLSRRDQP
jgi:molybdenum cofactor guanylyltransferase